MGIRQIHEAISILPIRVTPYQHQVDGFQFACGMLGLNTGLSGGGIAFLMEMGTGKTLTSIAVIGALVRAGKVRRVLIVAPLSILGVWREEFGKFAAFEYTLTVLSGPSEKKADTLRNLTGASLQVAVVNYESAWRLEKELLKWDADLILADEGHKLKSHNIAASKAMHRLGAKARYRLLLTGTVITNKAIDAFSQYKFLNPSIFGSSFYSFRNRYFDMVGYGQHTPVMKEHMKREFAERLHSIAFRATKAECLDLPETIDIIRHVDLEPAAAKIYRDLVRDSFAELKSGEVTVTNVLTRLLRLSQLTGGFLIGDEGGPIQAVSLAKMDVLEDILESSLQEGRKLVIIARFIPEIHAIGNLLEKKGVRYAQISGEIKNRDEQVTAFQNDPETVVFIGQIATAGMGITLTAASTMVFYSLDYSMSNFEQTKARIHRVGQKNNCTYIHLIARNTVDAKVLKALQEKANLAKALVDNARGGINPFV